MLRGEKFEGYRVLVGLGVQEDLAKCTKPEAATQATSRGEYGWAERLMEIEM